jgi:hypothetical protein
MQITARIGSRRNETPKLSPCGSNPEPLMSQKGHSRRIEAVGGESGLLPIADLSLRRSESKRWAASGDWPMLFHQLVGVAERRQRQIARFLKIDSDDTASL